MFYEVKQQYPRGPENFVKAFNEIKAAQLFVKDKLSSDASLKINVIYRIYEDDMLIEEWNQDKWQREGGSDESGSSGQQQKSSINFRPTPLSTSPRPPGTPPPGLKDEGD